MRFGIVGADKESGNDVEVVLTAVSPPNDFSHLEVTAANAPGGGAVFTSYACRSHPTSSRVACRPLTPWLTRSARTSSSRRINTRPATIVEGACWLTNWHMSCSSDQPLRG